jgi:hypothetical protein
MKYFLLGLVVLLSSPMVIAQSYTLEAINQNQARNEQLLNNTDSSRSFAVQYNSIVKPSYQDWKKATVTLLPFVLTQQYNTHHPFGWNDGAMIQAKGYQVLARSGVNIRYGIFEGQLAPELLYAQNKPYPSDTLYGNPNSKPYSQILPGQSFLKLNLGAIVTGVSTEHIWWGPGINSSLLMSNNAPGFLHAFIGTRKPIKTPIGNIEFNLIGARLTSNNALGYENNHLKPKNIPDNSRYLNSFVISWQPKWVKGLFLGMTRSLQQIANQAFNNQSGVMNKYLPILGLAFQKKNNVGDDTLNRDQLASFFLRWILPKSNAEFYIEFGKNDYGMNVRDYLLAPSHSAAYTVGFRKLIKQTDTRYIQIETELTQMSQTPDYLVRDAGNWYVHGQILQGYTNNNQILGSGAGFGANLQTISANWINGDIRNGFVFQRIERDPINKAYKWTDLSIGWMPQWKYKNMLIGAKIQVIYSNNYSWEKNNNPLNLHSRLMIQYNFR